MAPEVFALEKQSGQHQQRRQCIKQQTQKCIPNDSSFDGWIYSHCKNPRMLMCLRRRGNSGSLRMIEQCPRQPKTTGDDEERYGGYHRPNTNLLE
jgi:hypothetical protein